MARVSKMTESKDGVARMNISIPHRLSVEDIATYWLSQYAYDFDDIDKEHSENLQKMADALEKMTMTQIMKDVKTTLYSDGAESPHYRVGDNLHESSDFIDRAEDIIIAKLKG